MDDKTFLDLEQLYQTASSPNLGFLAQQAAAFREVWPEFLKLRNHAVCLESVLAAQEAEIHNGALRLAQADREVAGLRAALLRMPAALEKL